MTFSRRETRDVNLAYFERYSEQIHWVAMNVRANPDISGKDLCATIRENVSKTPYIDKKRDAFDVILQAHCEYQSMTGYELIKLCLGERLESWEPAYKEEKK